MKQFFVTIFMYPYVRYILWRFRTELNRIVSRKDPDELRWAACKIEEWAAKKKDDSYSHDFISLSVLLSGYADHLEQNDATCN